MKSLLAFPLCFALYWQQVLEGSTFLHPIRFLTKALTVHINPKIKKIPSSQESITLQGSIVLHPQV